MKVIGIAGKAGAGKDTVADWFVDNRRAVKMAWADPIKFALNAMFGWDMDQWDDREWREARLPVGVSPRYLAQTLGTEWGRETIDSDLWVYLTSLRVAKAAAGGAGLVVIPGTRFNNEAKYVRERGQVIIVRRADALVLDHKSESSLIPGQADIFIDNDFTKESLYESLEELFPLRFCR